MAHAADLGSNSTGPNELELVQRMLQLFGVDASRRALSNEVDSPCSFVAVADCVERRGLRARVVSLSKGDAQSLDVALVRLADGRLALWRGAARELTLPDGSVLAHGDVDALLGGEALEVAPPWPTRGKFLRRIWQVCEEQPKVRSALRLFALGLLVASALGFVPPALMRWIVDKAIPEGAASTLYVLVLTLFVAAATGATLAAVGERAVLSAELRLAASAQLGLFAHYLGLPLALLQRHSAGDVMQAQRAIPAVIHGVLADTLRAATDACLALGYLWWVASLAPGLAFGLASTYAILAIVTLPLVGRVARSQRQQLAAEARQADLLLEMIERAALLRARLAVPWAIGRWSRAVEEGAGFELKGDAASSLLSEVNGFAQRVTVGGAALSAAAACLRGERSLGELFAVVAAATAASSALVRLLGAASNLFSLREQLRCIERPLAQPALAQSHVALPPEPASGIVCDDVWFRYSVDSPWVLRGFSATFSPGRVHTIVWPSGRGKSTLLRLLSGAYVPERGAVSIFGLDGRAARPLVRYVPQGCPLFSGSIMHNLRILSGTHDVARLLHAAHLTGLGGIIENWSMGFETLVTGGGANLSSGQRQLVILTAALASTTPVLLLDEATSHVDLVMRAALEQSGLLQGRTIVNVVHSPGPSSLPLS